MSNSYKSTHSIDEKNYNPLDLKIKNYIRNNKSEDFDEIIVKDNDFEVFLNFSKTRQSILNWYDFKENADLLEIGGEFEALQVCFAKSANLLHVLKMINLEWNLFWKDMKIEII
ncbi:hypothetical protein QJS64_17125 [Paraclostridium bifermentans]|uniref:Uncharacterized protein n=1 Tax=Paraclostridium bifermentans TaxID=1490 RepID=A0ABY8R4T4_PARBF|nr:hypothetical protein QJS64_17125 [Paraclostridium bifermentans]